MAAPGDTLVFAPLGAAGLGALVAGDLAEASRLTGFDLPDGYLAYSWLWQLRLEQLRATPTDERWVAWVVARAVDARAIGHSGFHGAPDADGRVELSYTVLPEFRRRGYATEMLRLLIDYGREHPDVRVLRATISPDNTASLGTLEPFPFVHVGEQVDEIDGVELIFELAVD